MSPYRILFALVGFFGLVGIVPIWLQFSTTRVANSSLPVEIQFLAAISLPAVVAMWLASQLDPGGA